MHKSWFECLFSALLVIYLGVELLDHSRQRGLQPRRGSLPEPDHAGSLIRDLQLSVLPGISFCCIQAAQSAELRCSGLNGDSFARSLT